MCHERRVLCVRRWFIRSTYHDSTISKPALFLRGGSSSNNCQLTLQIVWRISIISSACGWLKLCSLLRSGASYHSFFLACFIVSKCLIVLVFTGGTRVTSAFLDLIYDGGKV